jgi:hypothetical protein
VDRVQFGSLVSSPAPEEAMTQHQSQDRLAPPPRGDVTPAALWADWVRQHWGAVRVIDLDVTPLADVVDRVRVRAVIHLGSLSPADVRVGAVRGAAESDDEPEESASELYSAQSYRNGTFVFEGFTVLDARDGERLLSVLVRPRAAHEDLSGLTVVARSYDDQAGERDRR